MNDILFSMLNQSPSEDFKDVDRTFCELVRYIDTLEKRISELEKEISLIKDTNKI